MDKLRFELLIISYCKGIIKKDELYELIFSYCIDKGKDSKASEMFTNFIISFSNLMPFVDRVVTTIMKDWGTKYGTIELHEVLPDGKTKLITIY